MSIIGGINFGNLTDYLFFFENGSERADWHDAKHGYLGGVAVNGITATQQTNGNIPYAGTIFTNDTTLSDWQDIVNANPGQAFASMNQNLLINNLRTNLINAFHQINALAVTTGFESVSAQSLDGLNTQNNINKIFVINITSGFDVNEPINITGDPGDVYILRWDEDADPSNGYQGRVRFRQGGAIVPHGGLTATNFINVAGQIDSAGGGNAPTVPYPQGPRYNNGTGALINGGSDWTAGGFFTGYWLTTGKPTIHDPVTGLWYGITSSLSDATFVGGWYTLTTQFILTAQSGGVYISPNPATLEQPGIDVKKYVSPDNGISWYDAETAPGPDIPSTILPQFKFVVTNIGDVPLSNITLTDSVYGSLPIVNSLPVGTSETIVITRLWSEGQHENEAVASGTYLTEIVSANDFSHYVGIQVQSPEVQIIKYVSPDRGVTWINANTPPGPTILPDIQPQFKFVVTNVGSEDLTNIIVTDDKFGIVGSVATLPVGQSIFFLYTAAWEEGQHVNTATVTDDQGVTDENSAYYTGVRGNPSITVKKYVSPDEGTTWFDADIPPGPTVYSNIQPQFKFVVTNTGNVPLTLVSLTDSVYGVISVGGNLSEGSSFTTVITRPWSEGQHENQATATGNYGESTVSSSDYAHYFGAEITTPGINIEKFVSVDNGVTWIHANTSPGPLLPTGFTPKFKYVVTNVGNQILTNINVNDNVLGPIGTLPELAIGESFQWIV